MTLTHTLIRTAPALVLSAFAGQAIASEPVSRDEVRAVVAEMLADAETRSSLQASSATGGYDKKFFLASADGAFRLNFTGSFVFRYTLNFRDDANAERAGGYPSGGDDFNPGFSMRRSVLRFDGHIIDPSLLYNVRIAQDNAVISRQVVTPIDPNDPSAGITLNKENKGDPRLRFDDIFFTYTFTGDFKGGYVKWGQYKPPFIKEELNSEFVSLAAERGVVNAFFSQDRAQGVSLGYEDERWWLEGMISDGLRTRNTPFGTNFNQTNDIALTGRAEYIFAGTRDQLRDYTSPQDQALAANIGAAVHWQHQNNDPSVTKFDRSVGSPANRSIFGATIDGQVEGSGLSLYVAGVLGYTRARNVVLDDTGATDSRNFTDWGVTVQGSWRFAEKTDVFAKYDGLFLDSDRGLTDRDQFHFITAGFVHYLAGHAAKLTLDTTFATNHTVGLTSSRAGWLGGSILSISNSDGSGLLGTARGFEAAVRLQMQVLF
jgi:hypothetical protein